MNEKAVDKRLLLLALSIVILSLNIRGPITSVGVLTSFIRDDLQISNTLIGFLTTLPLLMFALISPFVSKLNLKFGYGQAMGVGLILVLVGLALRSFSNVSGLLIGTGLIGAGIAIGNVLIPTIIKFKFPGHIGLMTSLFATCTATSAAIGMGVSVPLANVLGWRGSLFLWSALAVVILVLWLPQLFHKEDKLIKPDLETEKVKQIVSIYRSRFAWIIALFFGFQSMYFYSIVAWLPSILQSHGCNPVTAGYMAVYTQMISLPFNFIAPILATRMKNQKALASLSCLALLFGILIVWFLANSWLLYIGLTLLGIGIGTLFSLALSFISLRAPNARLAGELSGMSQSLGYFLAALGPVFIGFIYDHTASWNGPMLIFCILAISLFFLSLVVGRNDTVFSSGKDIIGKISSQEDVS